MAIDHHKARRSVAKLVKTAGLLDKALPDPAKTPTAAQIKRITTLHQQIGAAQEEFRSAIGAKAAAAPAVPPADGVPSTFNEFFSGVAASFANAQHTLDQRTQEYLAGIEGRPELMPTAFRISKVSADMKFAVNDVNTSSVGVIFFKDTSSTEVQNQQSVHFEMVAAPAPPGSSVGAPSVPLLFSAAGRQTVFDAIQTLAVAGDQTGAANLLAQSNRVLIYAEDPGKVVYLAYADAENFGLWRLEIAGPKLTVMRAFGRAAGDLDAARNSLLQLGTRQETFLLSIA